MYLYHPVLRKLFHDVLWEGAPDALYLTFDDGPHPDASVKVLRYLDTVALKATFFLSGSNVEAFPEIAREISANGHLIGNHGFSHRQLVIRSRRAAMEEVRQGAETILKVTGKTTTIFRPPYGMFCPNVAGIARKLGHRVVMFTIDTGDYSSQPLDHLSKRIERLLRPGAILLFHDNMKSFSKTIPLLEQTLALAARLSLPIKPVTDKEWK